MTEYEYDRRLTEHGEIEARAEVLAADLSLGVVAHRSTGPVIWLDVLDRLMQMPEFDALRTRWLGALASNNPFKIEDCAGCIRDEIDRLTQQAAMTLARECAEYERKEQAA